MLAHSVSRLYALGSFCVAARGKDIRAEEEEEGHLPNRAGEEPGDEGLEPRRQGQLLHARLLGQRGLERHPRQQLQRAHAPVRERGQTERSDDYQRVECCCCFYCCSRDEGVIIYGRGVFWEIEVEGALQLLGVYRCGRNGCWGFVPATTVCTMAR